MAKVDYYGIQEEIQQIIRINTTDVVVTIEEEMVFSMEATPWIGIYLIDRTLPDKQPIAMGKRNLFHVTFSIWVWCFSMELRQAYRDRDSWVSEVENILMRNRTLNDKVDTGWLSGGEMPSARIPLDKERLVGGEAFLAGGEVLFVCPVTGSVD